MLQPVRWHHMYIVIIEYRKVSSIIIHQMAEQGIELRDSQYNSHLFNEIFIKSFVYFPNHFLKLIDRLTVLYQVIP